MNPLTPLKAIEDRMNLHAYRIANAINDAEFYDALKEFCALNLVRERLKQREAQEKRDNAFILGGHKGK